MGAESLDSARRYDMYVHTQYISFSATARVRHGENDGSGRMSGSTSAASSRLNSHTPANGTSVLCSQYVPRTLALAPRTRSDLLPDLTQRISPSAHAGGCLRISLGLGLATPLAPLPSSRHHLRPQLAQGSETHLGLDASDSRCNCRAHPRLLDSVLAVLVPH